MTRLVVCSIRANGPGIGIPTYSPVNKALWHLFYRPINLYKLPELKRPASLRLESLLVQKTPLNNPGFRYSSTFLPPDNSLTSITTDLKVYPNMDTDGLYLRVSRLLVTHRLFGRHGGPTKLETGCTVSQRRNRACTAKVITSFSSRSGGSCSTDTFAEGRGSGNVVLGSLPVRDKASRGMLRVK